LRVGLVTHHWGEAVIARKVNTIRANNLIDANRLIRANNPIDAQEAVQKG